MLFISVSKGFEENFGNYRAISGYLSFFWLFHWSPAGGDKWPPQKQRAERSLDIKTLACPETYFSHDV